MAAEGSPDPPGKGTSKGEFFYHEENPFHDFDTSKPPEIVEAEEELETNVPPIRSALK
jgi:hypothetical protein